MTHTIHVSLGARGYDVLIGSGLLSRAGELIAPLAPTKRVFIVTDRTVAKHHRPALVASLSKANLQDWTITLPPGERVKSFRGLERLCRHLLQAGVDRSDLVIAFGGGVIGDLAGLGAGLVKRGVNFVQIPTTLLAQVDSSVGGKTAIDTPEGKNLVGLFNQPRLVIADTDVLATLPPRELRAGYAEVVKYGLISDAPFFQWCEANVSHIFGTAPAPFDPGGHYDGIMAVNEMMRRARDDALEHAVRVSVEAKARIVESDELDTRERALLNLGHTFAHALETIAGFDGTLLHGEAVAAGMRIAFTLSTELGYCSANDSKRVRAHLENAGFVTDLRKLPGGPYDADRLMELMAADKKAEAGKLTLILARAIGRAFIEKDAPADVVRELLQYETKK
jgi:3-dehydroquinate synthase